MLKDDPSPLRDLHLGHELPTKGLKDWLKQWKRAVNREDFSSTELNALLGWAFKPIYVEDDEERKRLLIFLTLVAGMNHWHWNHGRAGWHPRRLVENEALRILTDKFLGIPYKYEVDGIKWNHRPDTSAEQRAGIDLLLKQSANRQLGELLKTCLDPEVLRYLLIIFNPHGVPHHSWWKSIKGRTGDEARGAYFFQWLLRQLWWTGSTRYAPRELLASARRTVFPWMLTHKYLEPLRSSRKSIAMDPWFRLTLRRRVPIQKRAQRLNQLRQRNSPRVLGRRKRRSP